MKTIANIRGQKYDTHALFNQHFYLNRHWFLRCQVYIRLLFLMRVVDPMVIVWNGIKKRKHFKITDNIKIIIQQIVCLVFDTAACLNSGKVDFTSTISPPLSSWTWWSLSVLQTSLPPSILTMHCRSLEETLRIMNPSKQTRKWI